MSEDIKARLDAFERELFPEGVHYRIIRDYGRTADDKVGQLISSLGVAILTVVIFLAVFIGWRAALVVGLAVPVCYGILSRLPVTRWVTLFALILALGG